MFIRPIIALTLLGIAFQAGAAERDDVNQIIPGDIHRDQQDQPGEATRDQRARSGEATRDQRARSGEATRDQRARGRSDSLGDRQGMDKNPKAMEDGTWISISGTANDLGDDSFTLDYGNGEITVSMEHMDWYNESVHSQLDGSKVTVRGLIDDGWFVSASINATSVYAESLGSYFQANNSEGREASYSSYTATSVENGHMTVRGKVAAVNVDEHTFTINTGERRLTVNVSEIENNPFDNEGYQQLAVGDRVSVNGKLDGEMSATSELKANRVVSLNSQKHEMGQRGQHGDQDQRDRQSRRSERGQTQPE